MTKRNWRCSAGFMVLILTGCSNRAPLNDGGTANDAAAGGDAGCMWGGTWAIQPTPLTGNCNGVPPLPADIVVAADGTVGGADASPEQCHTVQPPDTTSCQQFVFCGNWMITLTIDSTFGYTGVATLVGPDAGPSPCGYTLKLTRIGP